MSKLATLLIITTALFLLVACASEQDSGDLRAFILEDTHKVVSANYKAQLSSDSIPKVLREDMDTKAYKANIERYARTWDMGKIDLDIYVDGSSGVYSLHRGQFNFKGLAERFNQTPLATQVEDWFAVGIDAWFSDDDGLNIVLLPEDNLIITGSRRTLEALRSAVAEETGLADESSGFGKLLYGTSFDSLKSEITSDCSLTEGGDLSPEGCVGVSWSVTGDAGSAQTSYMVLFDSAESADAAAPAIQNEIENTARWSEGSVEFTDFDMDGEVITFKARHME